MSAALLTLVLVLMTASVLATAWWRAEHGDQAQPGHQQLEQAKAQRRRYQPLIDETNTRRADNSFTPLISGLLGGNR